jgi:hypothetical protein
VENFVLKFQYKERPHILEVRPWIQQYKAVYRVVIEGRDIVFEPDEEGQLRAVADSGSGARQGALDHGLLETVAKEIEEHVSREG